jgi:hypothetical protein
MVHRLPAAGCRLPNAELDVYVDGSGKGDVSIY